MDNAWLDSLSEDWISEPRSAGSILHSLSSQSRSASASLSSQPNLSSSRIPVLQINRPRKNSVPHSSNSPLSERSVNDTNISLSNRDVQKNSKFRNDMSRSLRGRQLSKTLSSSFSGSVQHHTMQYTSSGTSPRKTNQSGETPEWKRRLLNGEVAYGEQRDLFSAAGLESMFNAPSPDKSTQPSHAPYLYREDTSTMPSSPPVASRSTDSEPIVDKAHEILRDGGRKVMKYRLADSDEDRSQDYDLTASKQSSPAEARAEACMGSSRNSSSSSQRLSLDTVPQHTSSRRFVSGQSADRHEALSPILIPEHSICGSSSGQGLHGIIPDKLQDRLKKLQIDDLVDDLLESSQLQPESVDREISPIQETTEPASNNNPYNLIDNTPSNIAPSRGHSSSPSPLPRINDSMMLPDESVQASTPKSKQDIINRSSLSKMDPPGPADIDVANAVPIQESYNTPLPEKTHSKPNDTTSPLKLFGDYDTFTNQKLLRRLSQLEDVSKTESPSIPHELVTGPKLETTPLTVMDPKERRSSDFPDMYRHATVTDGSQFGSGSINSYEFTEHYPMESVASNTYASDEVQSNDNAFEPRFQFRQGEDQDLHVEGYIKLIKDLDEQSINLKHDAYHENPTSHNNSFDLSVHVAKRVERSETPQKQKGDAQAKRLLLSPMKFPDPKRQRTLPKSEVFVHIKHHNMTEGNDGKPEPECLQIGKKRKDARHENNQRNADPQIMARRQVLRPRSHSRGVHLDQRPHDAHPHRSRDGSEHSSSSGQRRKIALVQAELDQANRGPSPNTSTGAMHDDSRKRSVTTQDFLDEAKKIMAGIRGKTRNGLTSVDESESEIDRLHEGEIDSFDKAETASQASTTEPFSRPPSREGLPIAHPLQRQDDPALIDRLRQYEEQSGMEENVTTAFKSFTLMDDGRRASDSVFQDPNPTQEEGTELPYTSEPPNVQITQHPDAQRKRKHSTSSIPQARDDVDGDYPTRNSSSSGPSTGRSIPTDSSKGSDSRRVIALHTVSHLIPEQLAGMVFDKERHAWVKSALLVKENGHDDEDDPFGDIPDLTVDDMQDTHKLEVFACRRLGNTSDDDVETKASELKMSITLSSRKRQAERPASSSSGLSKTNNFVFSHGTTQDTHNTSWSGEPALSSKLVVRTTTQEDRMKSASTITSDSMMDMRGLETVDHEISIHEGRESPHRSRRRNVTISFSSPVSSFIQPMDYAVESCDDSPLRPGATRPNFQAAVTNRSAGTRQLAGNRSSFIARPVSRIDETDEDSMREAHHAGFSQRGSALASTPLQTRVVSRDLSIIEPGRILQNDNELLELSPLSDFTMQKPDESYAVEISFVARTSREHDSKRTLSLSVKELVQQITDVEPYEPFWEHMKQIDFRHKNLQTLHKLDHFCGQVEELDISENDIGQLDGAPRSLRNLQASHNRLSDMTSWTYWQNLQYLDVSNNDLTSLAAFQDLVHLRSLRADNNKITTLFGVLHLDGLITLRLRGNSIETANFADCALRRLTDLDMKNNKLQRVEHLEELPSLVTLNLEQNYLADFDSVVAADHWTLQHLKLSGNDLPQLNVRCFPNLRLLYIDRNRLGCITGLLRTKRLDSLSMREQKDGSQIDLSFLDEAFEVRKLFLSGNLLTHFVPRVQFLNLQYLELANCGLEGLADDFGDMMTNVRVLNLNFNAICDITPLVGISRLKKLHLAGNRLLRLRKTTFVLSFLEHLSKVDLRNNPLTIGFYAIPIEHRVVLRQDVGDTDSGTDEPFTLTAADKEKDDAYAGRLDMETKMRRRVFEMLILGGCGRLKLLDGLSVDVSSLTTKDDVWAELIRQGIVEGNENEVEDEEVSLDMEYESGGLETIEEVTEITQSTAVREGACCAEQIETEHRESWGAEDSFA